MLHLSPSCNERTLPHTYKHPFPPLFTAHIDHLSWNGIVTEAKSRWDPALFHNNNFFNWASLPISLQPVLFIFAKIRDGILIDTRWVYDFESWGVQLLREIAIASVGSIVVSRGLEDKKNIKLIMNSVSQSRELWQMAAGLASKRKVHTLKRRKAGDHHQVSVSSGGQCH